MAEARHSPSQSAPPAGSLTALYTVPASTSFIGSTLVACNQGGATTFRVSVAVAGAADTPKQYIFYDVALDALETRAFTFGPTLNTADVVRCYSASGNVSFNLFGVDIT